MSDQHLHSLQLEQLLTRKISLEKQVELFHHWRQCSACATKIQQHFQPHFHIQPNASISIKTVTLNLPVTIRLTVAKNLIYSISLSRASHLQTMPSEYPKAEQFSAYFAQQPLTNFSLNKLRFQKPPSPFTQKVYSLTYAIPFGHYLNYGTIAKLISTVGASRAVGQVLTKNPFPIIIPCHRVLGKNKKLTGFAAGLDIKKILLQNEAIL